jgi:hypothetical protein
MFCSAVCERIECKYTEVRNAWEVLFGKPDERNSYLWDLGRNGRLKLRLIVMGFLAV